MHSSRIFAAGALLAGAHALSNFTLTPTPEFTNLNKIPVISGHEPCDVLIAAGLGDRVLFQQNASYETSELTYYTVTAQLITPYCILRPADASEVSIAVQALRQASRSCNATWGIAVRSAGHYTYADAINIADGVTIDLQEINATVVNEAGTIASVGTGSRWAGVYSEIEKRNLTVSGGRDGDVGVGGLLLGGGFSYHEARRGNACDDVANFEVVLANGTIVSANVEENPDLYRALKGGGNNLGIVTRFDLNSWENGLVFGGLVYMDFSYKDQVIDQFVNMIDINANHTGDSEVMIFSYAGATNATAVNIAANIVNVDGDENSTSFAPFNDIPIIFGSTQLQTYGELITSYDVPGPTTQRDLWWTLSFANRAEIIQYAVDQQLTFISEMTALFPASDLNFAWVFQPLELSMAQVSASKGGNMLGLDQTLTSNSVMFLSMVKTVTAEEEAAGAAKMELLIANLTEYTRSLGADTPFLYANYANVKQDPIGSYPAANVQFLKDVAAEYDPTGFFQKVVSGGFKVSQVNV